MGYVELVEWAKNIESENKNDFIKNWCAKLEDKNIELDNLAIWLAREFLDKKISFEIASNIFNQVMPVVGFENAPITFWTFYVVFEDFEVSENPDNEARSRIEEELSKMNR